MLGAGKRIASARTEGEDENVVSEASSGALVILDEAQLRLLIADAVREVLREEQARTPAPTAMPVSEYLDVTSAARIASVTPQTIRAWVKIGRLTRYTAGRQLRVKRKDLDAMMSSLPADTPSPDEVVSKIIARQRERAIHSLRPALALARRRGR